jgi:hypothetical protein
LTLPRPRVAGGIPPRAHEGVLDDILREGRVIRDAGRRSSRPCVLVSVVQLFESIELPFGQAHEHDPVRVVGGGRGSKPGRAVPPGSPKECASGCGFGSPARTAGRCGDDGAATSSAGPDASTTAKRPGSAAASARNPSRTRR